MVVHVLCGDATDCLQDLPACEYDSLITDPPAGIGFMGKDWDKDKGGRDAWVAWMRDVMKEAYRVLKPGAHGFVWALPRTSHWTATALEDAGFEIRDIVTHVFGSGFPKSLDVSKAIDKAAGAEREKIGRNPNHRKFHETGTMCGQPHVQDGSITAPATPDAKKWAGWGTALKPACEHWILIRKPLSEKTVAKNVQAHGTGAINIDASRVETEKPIEKGRGNRPPRDTGIYGKINGTDKQVQTQGRFPSNFICSGSARDLLDEQSGELKSGSGVKTTAGVKKTPSGWTCVQSEKQKYNADSGGASRFYFDGLDAPMFYCAKESKRGRNNGVERHLSWENQDQNLVDLMAELSQHLKGIFGDTALSLNDTEWNTISFGKNTTVKSQKAIKSTIKITIRLITEFQTLSWSLPLSIKDIIRDAIETIEASGSSLAEIVECFKKSKPTTTNEKMGLVLGASHAASETLQKIRENAKVGNVHSTVKPQKLMCYLIQMITPPGGKVLDPFAGSGSTGVAAVSLGHDFTGIEKEEEYVEIARKRIEHAEAKRNSQLEMF